MNVAESADFIAASSSSVQIDTEAVERAACAIHAQMLANPYSHNQWRANPLHPQKSDCIDSKSGSERDSAQILAHVFVIDLLNFSFWHDCSSQTPYAVLRNNTWHTGYWSLCAAIMNALDRGIPITNADYYSQASNEDFMAVFVNDAQIRGEIPMFNERCDLLRRAGIILVKSYDSHIKNLVLSASKSAAKLLKLMVQVFGEVFDDSLVHHGSKVSFHKRAQIFIADAWACFGGQSFGEFSDIEIITMFADYRVPQTLLYYGILKYSPQLMATLLQNQRFHSLKSSSTKDESEKHMIKRGDLYEIEIRGASIWAVELLVKELKKLENMGSINAIIVDFYLWDLAKLNPSEMLQWPIHLTRSIYY